MMRRLLIETVRSDSDYQSGNYTAQPRAMKLANVFFAVGTKGGTLAYQKLAPTRAGRQADRRPAGGAVPGRRQRLPLRLGFLARLQRFARARPDRGRPALCLKPGNDA
jgi:hypothetical protein